MSSSDAAIPVHHQQPTTSSPPLDPFKTEELITNATIQYDPSSHLSSSSTYYPPIQQRTDPSGSPGATGMGFDLNATGDDDDEDVDGQMQMYQEGAEGQEISESDEVDRRSVFVGNVDYGATPPELQEHFKNCGSINRITIMVDRYTGHPKGYAYIEFQDESAIPNAVTLNDSTFRERQLKVSAKRKNVPGFSTTNSRGRGGSMRGGYMGRGGGGFRGGLRGRGRGVRGGTGYLPRYRGRGSSRGVSPY